MSSSRMKTKLKAMLRSSAISPSRVLDLRDGGAERRERKGGFCSNWQRNMGSGSVGVGEGGGYGGGGSSSSMSLAYDE